ncbi:dienelactone hydrolase [Xylona heveae TC161]|uniref:Dienelactone hydrolase n=1 Tax=Xylona heveae (strain CBS 132557 / TC161) TaxID=1328760 RepID=A0A165FHT2_XYLHT|nr:dienelactone hydrolase [Xylona heveae TC161]KZF20995.1 dienelactone hydrolase [Xylona heveae TC161]
MTCEACRTLPVVISTGYSPKGSYEKLAGLEVYVTGPRDAKIGLIDVYDIFGMASQTIQGADILASELNAIVLVPDFLKGEAAKNEWVPPNTDEKMQLLMKFVTEKASIPENTQALLDVAKEAKETFPTVNAWGTVGLCWGGKVVALISGAGTPFVATGQVHPGRMEKADAEKITVPHIVLASKDEPAEAVAEYKEVIEKNGTDGYVETYANMHHGWMGARANLEDEENKKEYLRAYTQLSDFFKKHLK